MKSYFIDVKSYFIDVTLSAFDLHIFLSAVIKTYYIL